MYTLVDGETAVVSRDADGAFIPADPDNADWQVYQAWLAAGNTATPAPAPSAADLTAYAASVRYARETGGVTVSGQAIRADRDSRNLISGAVSLLGADTSLASVDFKAPTGWVQIPRAQMIAIGLAVERYVQACFTAEQGVDADIAAGTAKTHADIDASTRWPSTAL